MRRHPLSLLTICVLGLIGCQRPAGPNKYAGPIEVNTGTVAFPDLPAGQPIQPGIVASEVALQRNGIPMKVWVYKPEAPAAGKLPLVLVPPAGSTLFVGMNLGDGDRAEHYPYARAGFAVVSFEIDGHVPNLDNASDQVLANGASAFEASLAGMANAKAALDFALAKVPNVDAERIYIAGHSSAATLALLYASHEPRIKGCAAYAPATDVEARLRPVSSDLNRIVPGYSNFIRFSSPRTHVAKLTCPVFLFHALDDDTVASSESTNFAEELKKTNSQVTLVTVPAGGHYQSMIDSGIPQGIAWMKKLGK